MLGIPIQLNGMPLVTFRQEPVGVTAQCHRRRVKERFAWYQAARLLHVWKDFERWLFGAGGQTGQRQRGRRHFQKASPVEPIPPLSRSCRKLAPEHFTKLSAARRFFEAAPILLAVQSSQAFSQLANIQ